MKIGCAAAAVFFVLGMGAAQAADLAAVHKSLAPLRQGALDPANRMRPEFLTARDGLRDWIDARLASLPRAGDTDAFAKMLNMEIVAADLACAEAKSPGYNRCTSPGELDARGYLGNVDVGLVRDLLIVQAETGVPCGFDETVYVYEWRGDRWRRLLDSTRVPDANGVYVAEQVQQVVFSATEDMPKDALLLLTTGVSPVCASAPFTQAHYRVWSARRGGSAELLIDGREGAAYIKRRDPTVSARFEGNDLLLEMDVASIDPSRRIRVAVTRFSFTQKRVRRIAPIALTPRDFVEEWLRAPWNVAAEWTQMRARPSLQKIHATLNADGARGAFSGPTQRCNADDGVVQVGVRFANGERFFRLKTDPAGAYDMRAVDSEPARTCTRTDAGLDAPRSLFLN